jgi:hypothetical protein
MLTFTALWLGVIVPVHTRGVIRLAGAAPDAATDAHRCCAAPSKPAQDNSPPCSGDKQSCAICYFIATLDLPPADDLDLAPTGRVEPAIVVVDHATPSVDHPLLIHGRAPPPIA